MDAVELSYPVDVSKLRVTEECEPLVNSSIERCSTSVLRQDATGSVVFSHSTSRETIPNTGNSRHDCDRNCCRGEELSEQHDYKGFSCRLLDAVPESVRVQRKIGKVSRSNNGCAKRARIGHPEETSNSAGVDETKDVAVHVLGKNQTLKQKNSSNGKQGDKRNFKVPLKLKYDLFSTKACLTNSNGGAGGNSFLGLYGLKSDVKDLTKLIEDLSLDELLDGNYECPNLRQDKEKQVTNAKENFLHVVRHAFSVLPLGKHFQCPKFCDIDAKKMSSCSLSSVSVATIVGIDDQVDTSEATMSSCSKDLCGELEIPAGLSELPVHQTRDILERLALPPPKNLESLLQDAAKPSASSRNTSDLRSGKQISRRSSLPPFPWSHTYTGHCRTNSDAVKLLANRSTCPGRWMKIAHKLSSPMTSTNCFTDLESVVYNHTLVPSGPDLGTIENKIIVSSGGPPLYERVSSSLATCSRAVSISLAPGVQLKDQGNAGHCPKVLAAARTLYDFATCVTRQKPVGINKWPKKSSQKAMKARKSNLIEKTEDVSPSLLDSDMLMPRGMGPIMPSKRPKLYIVESKRDPTHTNFIRKGPITWSTPRSSRSSPRKSVKHLNVDVKHTTSCITKETSTMHPPAAALGKACSGQHKLRKLMSLD